MKWIPASNPPKDCDEEFILQISGEHENAIYEHAVVTEGYYENGNWYLRGVKLPDEVKVEYWMQLPEPVPEVDWSKVAVDTPILVRDWDDADIRETIHFELEQLKENKNE